MSSLYKASKTGKRLDSLLELRDVLAVAIDECESMRDLAALSKQYRETLTEIDIIQGVTGDDDEISTLLQSRSDNGLAGAVRKTRT